MTSSMDFVYNELHEQEKVCEPSGMSLFLPELVIKCDLVFINVSVQTNTVKLITHSDLSEHSH